MHYNSMKRIITILVALTAVLSMNAQGRHEIEVLMGGPVSGIFFNEGSSYAKYDYYYSSSNTLKDLYEDVKYRDSFIGMGLVYSYEVKSWLKLGIDATASIEEVTIRKGLAYKEDANNLYSQGVSHFTVMPMARIRYKDGYKAEAYGRIAAGMEGPVAFDQAAENGIRIKAKAAGRFTLKMKFKDLHRFVDAEKDQALELKEGMNEVAFAPPALPAAEDQ